MEMENTQLKTFENGFDIERINKGTFTILNEKTGQHRTFMIRRQDKDASFAPGKQIVSIMKGTDNEHDFRGFGFIDNTNIVMWKRSLRENPIQDIDKMAHILHSMLRLGLRSPFFDKGLTIMPSTTCFICGRKLTNPESIETGIGPVCAGKE